MSTCHGIPFTLAELRKAETVEFIGVWEGSFISMSGTGRDGDQGACGDSHAVGKRERPQYKAAHGHCKHGVCPSAFRTWMPKKEAKRTEA
jgi:hypothetical protein